MSSQQLEVLQSSAASKHEETVTSLAASLGFDRSEDKALFAPYIAYVQAHWPGKGTKADFMCLFADLVVYFRDESKPSVQSYIDRLCHDEDHFYFQDTIAGSNVRKIAVEDNVLLVIGLWTLMRGYFVPYQGRRHILLACESTLASPLPSPSERRPTPLMLPLNQLIQKSSLLPSRKEAPAHDEPLFSPSGTRDALDHANIAPESVPFGLHLAAGLTESLSIEPSDLNMFKLTTLAGLRILWTDNISRHLLLSKRGQRRFIELFALPCAVQSGAHDVLRDVGISVDVMDEIELSYANLFNPKSFSGLHKHLGRFVGVSFWCWCLHCSSRRLRDKTFRKLKERATSTTGGVYSRARGKRTIRGRNGQVVVPFDPLLIQLAESEASWWEQGTFEHLWPRIVALDRCLQEARPWNFWVLLRDNRDTVQYWTFLFGSIILVLTVLQVILGALQVASVG